MTAQLADRTASDTTAPSRRFGISELDLGLLVVRVIVGVIFVGHGAQKLFGAFGGSGIDGTARFFESAGYSPGKLFAVLGGLAEFGGGLALIIGLLAPFAAAAITATMAGALSVKIDGNSAFFAQNGGYEYELLLTGLVLGLLLTGAGRLSLDHGRFWNRGTVRLALAVVAVVAGLLTALVR